MKKFYVMILVAVLMAVFSLFIPVRAEESTTWVSVYSDHETDIKVNDITVRYDIKEDFATVDVLAKDKVTKKEALLNYEIDFANAQMRLSGLRDLDKNSMLDISERFESKWHSPYGVELEIFKKVNDMTDREELLKKKNKKEEANEKRRERQETRSTINDGVDMVNSINRGIRAVKRVVHGDGWYY